MDWKNPRVICIAESYNKFDIDTVEVVPIRIELYKYRFYENKIVSLDLLNGVEQKETKVTNGIVAKSGSVPPAEENDAAGVTFHLRKASDSVVACFDEMRSRILELDESIQERINRNYIAYGVTKYFAEVHIAKSQIKIHLRPAKYHDPNNLIETVPESFGWSLSRRVYLKAPTDLPVILGFMDQSYTSTL